MEPDTSSQVASSISPTAQSGRSSVASCRGASDPRRSQTPRTNGAAGGRCDSPRRARPDRRGGYLQRILEIADVKRRIAEEEKPVEVS